MGKHVTCQSLRSHSGTVQRTVAETLGTLRRSGETKRNCWFRFERVRRDLAPAPAELAACRRAARGAKLRVSPIRMSLNRSVACWVCTCPRSKTVRDPTRSAKRERYEGPDLHGPRSIGQVGTRTFMARQPRVARTLGGRKGNRPVRAREQGIALAADSAAADCGDRPRRPFEWEERDVERTSTAGTVRGGMA